MLAIPFLRDKHSTVPSREAQTTREPFFLHSELSGLEGGCIFCNWAMYFCVCGLVARFEDFKVQVSSIKVQTLLPDLDTERGDKTG